MMSADGGSGGASCEPGSVPAQSAATGRVSRWWLAGLAVTPVLRAAVAFLAVSRGEPWRRQCPTCRRRLVFPWLSAVFAPAGRCPGCRTRIGAAPYLLEVAVIAAVLLLVLSARHGVELLVLGWFAAVGAVAAFVDLAVRRLPNVLTATAACGQAIAVGVAAAVGGDMGALVRALAGGIVVTLALGVLGVARAGALGGGDVKFGFTVGTALGWMGWFALYAGLFLSFALSMVYAVVMLVARRASRRDQFAFGPFLVTGTLLAAVLLP